MPAIILNGNTYDNTTYARPISVTEKLIKVGPSIVAANGARTFVHRATKREWQIEWGGVLDATRGTVASTHALSTTWTFVDEHGTSYTVQTEEGDYESTTAFADHAGTQYYDVSLTLREA